MFLRTGGQAPRLAFSGDRPVLVEGRPDGPSGDGPDTCKRFASRRYNAARKDALKRGRSPEEASEAARKAHRKAVAEWNANS